MSSKYHGDNRPKSLGVPVLIEVTNPKKGSKHRCPCIMPFDCIGMDKEMFDKAYGPHIIQAVFDLLQHESFKAGLAKPNLIIAP
jgi:hypothetical protein